MFRPFVMSGLLVLAVLSGCLGGDGDDDEPSPSPTKTGRPTPGSEGSYRVLIRNYTTEGAAGQPINVTWEITPDVDEQNATNESAVVSHTSIHWGDKSVPSPYTGEEPRPTPTPTPSATFVAPMTTHTTATATATATATGTTTPSPTGGGNASAPTDYRNETREQKGVAGATFNESFFVNSTGLVYLRAHAIVGNWSFWSDEVSVNVTNASVPLGKTHRVAIGSTLPGQLATYNPVTVDIKLGDQVEWQNADRLFPHTATSRAGAPQSFDTGNIPASTTSKPIHFTLVGSYTYGCTVHPSMAPGTIRVT